MTGLLVVIQFILGFGVFVYLIWPLLAGEDDRFPILEDLSDQRRRDKVIEALRDLEFERETGKLNEQDYRELRNHYLNRAVKLFDEEDLASLSIESTEADTDVEQTLEERIARERETLE